MRLDIAGKNRNLIKVWLGMAALVLCLLMGEETAQAFETEHSQLFVDGTYLVRRGVLLRDKITKDNGTVTYDEKNNILTIENYTTTSGYGIEMQDMSGIRIVFKGTNTITGGMGIDADQEGDMIISGGTVNMKVDSPEIYGTGITTRCSSIIIENCNMNISSSYNPIGCGGNLTIRNSNITLKRTGVNELNNPEIASNIYNERDGFPGLIVSEVLQIENSSLDVTGINYAVSTSVLPVIDEKLEITDENGTSLHLVKIHWPRWWAFQDDEEGFRYAYSASTAQELYYFDELPNRVLIKPKQTAPEQNGNTGEAGDNGNGNTSTGSTNGGADNIGETNNSGEESSTGTENNADNNDGNENNSGKQQVTKKINKSYYRGVPASGKVTYVKPASKKITKITIPATVKINGYVCKVTAIDKNAFKGCKKLKSVKIGKNVQTIGERAFYQCTSLKKISIPGKVKSIKKEAFAGCKNLQNVTFQGKKVTSIEKNAFKNTKKKIKVSIPKSKYKAYKKLLKGTGLKSPVYKKIS